MKLDRIVFWIVE